MQTNLLPSKYLAQVSEPQYSCDFCTPSNALQALAGRSTVFKITHRILLTLIILFLYKHIRTLIRQLIRIAEIKPVEAFDILHTGDLPLSHEAYHLTSGHLDQSRSLNDLTADFLPEYTTNHSNVSDNIREMHLLYSLDTRFRMMSVSENS